MYFSSLGTLSGFDNSVSVPSEAMGWLHVPHVSGSTSEDEQFDLSHKYMYNVYHVPPYSTLHNSHLRKSRRNIVCKTSNTREKQTHPQMFHD